jgi:competence protein ComEC
MRDRFPSRAGPRWALAPLLLATLAGVGVAGEPGKLVVTCLEVPDVQRGAGLAVVIETPGGKTYLYDTGNGYPTADGGWAGGHNSGRDLILPYLKSRKIEKLDGVLISHAHYDHFGGLLWLVDHVPIDRLYDAGYHFKGESSADYGRELADYDALRERFKARPGAYREAHTGETLELDPALAVEVTAPPRGFFDEPHPERRPATDPPAHYLVNANSLGIRIRHGDQVFLLPGDIQKEDQVRSLLPGLAAGKLRCTILVAPGHGIHATPEFALATRPEVTIASVMPRYARTSPSPKVYGAVGSRVFLTGVHGRVVVTSDGKSYTLDVERPDPK